jgi:hypothetical protein
MAEIGLQHIFQNFPKGISRKIFTAYQHVSQTLVAGQSFVGPALQANFVDYSASFQDDKRNGDFSPLVVFHTNHGNIEHGLVPQKASLNVYRVHIQAARNNHVFFATA